eukprot:gene45103-1167_t
MAGLSAPSRDAGQSPVHTLPGSERYLGEWQAAADVMRVQAVLAGSVLREHACGKGSPGQALARKEPEIQHQAD